MALVGLALAGLAACGILPEGGAPDGSISGSVPPLPLVDTCGAAPYAYLLGQPGVALEKVLIMREIRIGYVGDYRFGPERPGRITFDLEEIPQPEGARPTRNTTRIAAISCG